MRVKYLTLRMPPQQRFCTWSDLFNGELLDWFHSSRVVSFSGGTGWAQNPRRLGVSWLEHNAVRATARKILHRVRLV